MHDDHLDPATAAFFAGARLAYGSTEAPAPRPALQELFADGIASSKPVSARAQAPIPSRRRFMFLDIFKGLPTKISAGALGAAIALSGVGAGGALPVTMMLTSNEAEEVELEEDAGAAEGSDAEGDSVEEIEGDDEASGAGPSDEASPVATAAQNHEFDEACGNHGAYVSHFALHGEAPECAGGAASDGEVQSTTTDTEGETEEAQPRRNGKAAGAGSARPAGKGKGGRP